ncbi:MAG: hypothetical protein DHS20C21_07170 [Gemmatimonadota bacterium]|nr:MAG: hypothetical protein DHS20C21_07170 [Gemmatimonadota bacterium]
MTHMFGDIRYTYTDRRSSRFSRVRDRPGYLYQFGLSSLDLGLIVPRSGANLIEDNSTNTYDSRLDTSFQPASALFMSVAYQRSINRRSQNGSRNKTDNVTFPDVSLSLDGLENLALFRRWTKTTSLSSSYRKQVNRAGRLTAPGTELEPGRPWYDTEATDVDFSPLVSLTATTRSGLSATLAHNRSKGIDESITDFSSSRTEATSSGYRLTGRYGFSAPNGFSFFGKRIRFRSDLTLNLDIDRTEQKSVESNATTTTTRSHRKTLSVKPRATYNFSRKVQGSLDISYGKSKDLQLDRTETVVSVALEALIKF